MTPPDADLPLPPPELRDYVGNTSLEDANFEYLVLGEVLRDLIVDVLPEDWSWEGKRVLDFGCGAGRVLRHFRDVADRGEFHGCDIHEESIAWARRELSPPFRFGVNEALPPLPYPDGHFDLIYGVSVFTHLTDAWPEWLLEMHRLLAPEGRLFQTFLGRGVVPAMTGEDWDDRNYGANFAMVGNPWEKGGPAVYHSPWWLRAHWGRLFCVEDLRDYEGAEWPEHGVILLRKDDRPVPTPEDLIAPEPGEPREFSALRKNVADLQGEVLAAREAGEPGREPSAVARAKGRIGTVLARTGIRR